MANTDYEQYLQSLREQSAAQSAAHTTYNPYTPDAMAENERIATELGLPTQLIIGQTDVYRPMADQQTATRALNGAPKTGLWVRDPVNAALAKDDLASLSAFETRGGALARAVGRGTRQLGAAVPYLNAQSAATIYGDIGKSLDDLIAEEMIKVGGEAAPAASRVQAMQVAQVRFERAAGLTDADRDAVIQYGAAELAGADAMVAFAQSIPLSDAAAGFRDGTLATSENTVMGTLGAFVDDPVRGAAFLAETAAETLPILAAASATTVVTRAPTAGAAVAGGGAFLRENTTSAIGFLQERGVDMSTPDAAAAVLLNTELMSEAQELGVTRGLIIAVFDAVSGGVAGQRLMNSPAGDMITQTLAQAALGSGGEATAQLATTGEIDAREVVIEGLAEMVTAPVEVVGVGGRMLGQRAAQAASAGQTADQLQSLDDLAAGSKLRQRAPDRFEQALEAQGYDQQAIYVPAADVRTLFQADGRDWASLEDWGIDPDEAAEAELAGGDVGIPASVYAARIAGTPDAEWIKANGTLDADEMSLSQAAEFNARVSDIAQQEAERAIEADRAEREAQAGDQQVYDDVYSQLRAAGRAPDAAAKEASVWSAFMRAMAARTGQGDALDVARRMPVSIRGPQEAMDPAARRKLDAQIDLIRDRGARAIEPGGAGVLEYVRLAGGVQDRGGDIEALDVPSGVVAETAGQIAEREGLASLEGIGGASGRGLTLDEIGRRLIADGYFPEYLGGVDIQADGTEIDTSALALQAIGDAVRGEDRRPQQDQADPDLVALAAALDGMDLASMSNDEVIAALEEGVDLFQADRAFDVIPGVDLQAPAGLVKIDELPEKGQEKRAAREALRMFRNGDFKTSDGTSVTLRRNGIGKLGRFPKGDWQMRAAVMAHLDEIVAASEVVGTVPDRERVATRKWLYTVVQVEVAGQRVVVSLSLQRDDTADRAAVYAAEGFEVVRADVAKQGAQGGPEAGPVSSTRPLNVGQAIQSIKTGQTLFQSGPPVDSEAFMRWFGNSKVVDEKDDPLVVGDEVVRYPASTTEYLQGPRGRIRLPKDGVTSGGTVIDLMETADLSTFLHESAHFFLEAMAAIEVDGDAQMQVDMATIRDWLGAEGDTFTTEQHETFARGFEAYLLEGKAPSLVLADAFSRFKAWLARIYRTAAGLNVNISPEMREVFDRMLATEAEITEARAAQEMDPLFASGRPAGMSDAEWATYQRMARRGAEQAEQSLRERTMAKVRRDRTKEWKDERKAVRAEVEAQVDRRPEQRLIQILANGKFIGNDDADVPDMRIDKAALEREFGPTATREINQQRLGGKRAIYAPDGETPQDLARFFGFPSATAMMDALRATGKRKDVIEAETDRIMYERYGDPLNDGSIEEEAMRAVHSEQQAKTAVAEARQLAKQMGRPTRGMQAKVYRQRARRMIEGMTTRDVMNPRRFLAAERKAARRAQEAFAKVTRGNSGALADALMAKEQQVLSGFLFDEAVKVEKLVASKREEMMSYRKASVRKKLDGGYIEQIDAILEHFDFRQRAPGQVARSESLSAFVVRMIDEGREAELNIDPRLINDAQRRHYSRLTVGELMGVFDTIDNLDHLGRHKGKLLEAKEQRELEAEAEKLRSGLAKNINGKPPNRTPTRGERTNRFVRNLLNTTLNADTLLREIDGFTDLGPAWMSIKSRIDRGSARVIERRTEASDALEEIYGAYSGKEKRAMNQKIAVPGVQGEFSKWDILAVALNSGNEGNFSRLTGEQNAGSLSQNEVNLLLGKMDDRDWRVVQGIWDHIDGYWPEISAKEKRQTGVTPKKVEAKILVDAPDFVRGGYYPVKYDDRLSGLAADFQQKELAESLMGGRFGKAQTRNGHTKDRSERTTQAVLLDLSVAHAHIEQVIYDLELGEAVNSSWRILQKARGAFQENGRQEDFDALELWLQDVAAGERVVAGGIQSAMRWLRTGFTVSRLALNISTALIQPSGLLQSAVVVGKGAIARGTIDYVANLPRWVSDVAAVSPMMRQRQLTMERDMYNILGDLEAGPVTGRWEIFMRDYAYPASFVLMQKVQFYAVDMPTWVSAYQKVIRQTGDEEKARLYADSMVERAQGSGSIVNRGKLERGTLNAQSRQQELPRMLTALGSYMFAKGNIAYEKVAGTDFRNPAQVMSLAVDIAFLFTLEALVYSAVKGGLPEEDEDDPIGWALWLAEQTFLSAGSSFPVAREVSGAIQGFGGGGIFGSSVEVMAKPIIQASQGEIDKALVKSLVDAGGVALHLPSSQTKVAIEAMFKDDMSLNRNASPVDALGLSGGQGRSLADFIFGQ